MTDAVQVQCPVCELWFPQDGAEGVFPHALEHHPGSHFSEQVRLLLGLHPPRRDQTKDQWLDRAGLGMIAPMRLGPDEVEVLLVQVEHDRRRWTWEYALDRAEEAARVIQEAESWGFRAWAAPVIRRRKRGSDAERPAGSAGSAAA